MRKLGLIIFIVTQILLSCSKSSNPLLRLQKVEFITEEQIESALLSTGVYVNELTDISLNGLNEIPVVGNMQFHFENGQLSGDNLYLDKTKRYKISAYAPFISSEFLKPQFLTFNHGTDVLWAEVRYPDDSAGVVLNRVKLNYEHLTSNVKFFLADERDSISRSKYDFEKATFSISGFSKNYTLNTRTGELMPGEIDPSVIITNESEPTCFSTPDILMDYKIIVNIPSKDTNSNDSQTLKSKFSYLFKPGCAYELVLSLLTNEISVKGDLVKWDTQLSDKLEL